MPSLDPTHLLVLAVVLPFAASAVLALLGRHLGNAAGWLVLLGAVGSFASLVPLMGQSDVPTTFRLAWIPSMDVAFALRGDPFGLFLGFLVSGVGSAIALYAIAYMSHEDRARLPGFYATLAAFMGAMLGIALADDLILLFVFWEVTSVSSFLLIGYRRDQEQAKAGALMAFQVTALGGLAMLVGFLLVGQIADTHSISALAGYPGLAERVNASPLAAPALLLILVGAFTKSAQFPFHFWLPRAMVAPTPVSAYLHAATMVKAGVFLLGRMLPVFGSAPLWTPLLVAIGGTTMLLSALLAFRETDLKAILARTTGSTLGLITLLYGLGAAEQDALQMLNHALYKGALFLVAGIVEHRVHTRDIRQLGGLRRDLPLAFVACLLACVSMAGVPPMLGFLAKESTAAELLRPLAGPGSVLAASIVLIATGLANALIAAVSLKLLVGVFLGPPSAAVRSNSGAAAKHAESPPLWIAPLALAATALGLGVLGLTSFTEGLAAAASSGVRTHLHLSLVPELGLPLYVSIATLALAGLLYAWREPIEARLSRPSGAPRADVLWQEMVAGLAAAGEAFSSRWQNGSLRWYFTVTLLVLPLLSWYALSAVGLSYQSIALSFTEMPWYGLLFCVLLAIGTLTAVRATTRLQAAIATTAIGFLVSMLFVVYRSPDILLTQILIETVSTIFVLLVLIFLPAFPKQDLRRLPRMVNFVVAGAFSLAIVVLLLLSMTPGLREPDNIATRPGGLLSLALSEGGGANAVNVIIADIRAMDTTGEITVLVVVGLCVYGLLRARRSVP